MRVTSPNKRPTLATTRRLTITQDAIYKQLAAAFQSIVHRRRAGQPQIERRR